MPKLKPPHPGEVLREEFLTPLGLSAAQLAKAIGVPPTRIEQLVAEQGELSPSLALLLARHLGTTTDFWMALQSRHERERAS
ncbi:MAG TPA: HigA family addiction module antitoxin [Mesorhizobium sp.]|nr:HigA family addiction module antitoxin [Mesorhizobium sp.]